MSRKFKIGGSSKSLKDLWKEKIAASASLDTDDGKWNNITSLGSASDDDYKNYKFKVNKKGEMEPILSDADIGADDIVFGASKSNLRRMADLERNVSIIANKISTIDAETDISSSDAFDNWITEATAFTKDVTLGKSSQSSWSSWLGDATRVDVDGHLYINNGMTLGSTAKEVIQDIVIQPMLTGNTESDITVTYDDSSDEIDFTVNSAPKWSSARTITLGGDASGSVSIDGSANKTLTVAVANDSHTHDGRYYTETEIDSKNATFVTKTSNQALSSQANAMYMEGNVLKLKRGSGDIDAVDIAPYLDDTNLARITSGTMNSAGLATFRRDDDSTFTVDMSVLLDDTNLSRIVSAAWNTGNGVLTLTRNDGTTVQVDLDGRFDNYNGWDLFTDGTNRGRITTGENVNFVGGTNVSLAYSATDNTITINSSFTDTHRAIHDTPVNGATTTSISSNWAFDNVKTAVPSGAVFTDTNTWRGISDTPGNDSGTSISRKWAMGAFVGATVSNDTITFTKGDGTTTAVTTSDANSNTYITGLSFATGTGVLTATRNSGAVTVDLDGRYQLAGSYQASGDYVGGGEYHNFGSISIGSTTTAALITDLTSKGFFSRSHSVGKCSWSYAGNGDLTDTGFGTFELAGCVVETFVEGGNKTVRITRPNTGGDGPSVLVYNDQGNGTYSPGWREMVTSWSGNTNITGNLTASGDITANGGDMTATRFNGTATYAKYADLAERYAADAEYAEGTVMAFGGDAEVTAAVGYASGKLAGVVSHKPAVAMNADAGDNATHPFIALQGRVPVRVEGEVKKGDILVASDIAGLAAVWMDENTDPRMTAYVGIAISDSVDGMVEVKVGK